MTARILAGESGWYGDPRCRKYAQPKREPLVRFHSRNRTGTDFTPSDEEDTWIVVSAVPSRLCSGRPLGGPVS